MHLWWVIPLINTVRDYTIIRFIGIGSVKWKYSLLDTSVLANITSSPYYVVWTVAPSNSQR